MADILTPVPAQPQFDAGRQHPAGTHPLEMRIRVGQYVTCMAVLLLVMSGLDALIGAVLDNRGQSWTATRLMGLGYGAPSGWTATFPAEFADDRKWWLTLYLLVDLAFILLYVTAARRARHLVWAGLRLAISVLACVDVAEDLAAAAMVYGAEAQGRFANVVSALTTLKSIVILVIYLLIAFKLRADQVVRQRVKSWGYAISRHGFALVVVVPLAVLSVLPGNDLLDQLPDVQRRWLLPDPSAEHIWDEPGVKHAASAVLAVLFVAVALFVLGRLRSSAVMRRTNFGGAQLPEEDEAARRVAVRRSQWRVHNQADLRLAVLGPVSIAAAYLVILLRSGVLDQPWPKALAVVVGVNPGLLGATVPFATFDVLAGLLVGPFVVFALLPLLIAALSGAIRHAHQADHPKPQHWWQVPAWWRYLAQEWFPVPTWQIPTDEEKQFVVRAGDLIATWALVLAALGIVRSYTPILMLSGARSYAGIGWAAVGFILAVAAAVGAWPAMRCLTSRVSMDLDSVDMRRPRDGAKPVLETVREALTPSIASRQSTGLRLGVFAVGITLLLVLGSFPEQVPEHLGVVAIATLALLAGCLVIGGIVGLLEPRLSPEAFWFWPAPVTSHRGTTPVTAVVLAAVVATWSLAGADVHGLRGLRGNERGSAVPSTMPPRPTMHRAFTDWVAATTGCGSKVPQSRDAEPVATVRPMFLVASEGGGIRAAYWAAASMDLLSGSATFDTQQKRVAWGTRTPSRCARALLSAGASGGSVGLAVARFAPPAQARARVVTMAAADGLGAATLGLLVRDLVYGATGLPVFGRPGHAPPRAGATLWADRAALMEDVWGKGAGLNVPFLPADGQGAATSQTGVLVMNSTRVSDGCRAWVSQVDVQSPAGTGCDGKEAPAGHTIDALKEMWQEPRASRQLCLGSVSAATAAMLTARFPFVTPSGVAGPCGLSRGIDGAAEPDTQEAQFVDGGYVENTGLKTIIDLGPGGWLTEVQQYNEKQLRDNQAQLRALEAAKQPETGGGPKQDLPVPDLIVPVVVYLDNGTGSDVAHEPNDATAELLVPSRTTSRAKFAPIDAPSLIGDLRNLVAADVILPGGAELEPLRAAVNTWRREGVFSIQQTTFPALTAPLGWVLSQHSVETMDHALFLQGTTVDDPGKADPLAPAPAGSGSLNHLLKLVSPAP